MRRNCLIVFFALISLTLLSENGGGYKILERVYVSTDKDVYVAGDNLWCSAFCFDVSGDTTLLSKFSSTVYLELVSDEGVAQTAKIGLTKGRGAGVMSLRTDLRTGNYQLFAYTSQNRNEKDFMPVPKTISIYNVLNTERVNDNVIIDEAHSHNAVSDISFPTSGNEVKINHPGSVSSAGSFPITIENLDGGNVSLSVSIYHEDTLSTLNGNSIGDFFQSRQFLHRGGIERKFIPDYEGEVLKMKIDGLTSDDTEKGLNMICSVSGKGNRIYTSSIDSLSMAYIYTNNIYDDVKMFCQMVSFDTLIPCTVNIEDPFIRYKANDIPKLHIDKSSADKLQMRGIGMQIGRRFGVDTLFERIPVREDNFLGNYKHYHLDDYTRFPQMSEVIIEYIPELARRTRGGKEQIRVMLHDSFNGLRFSNGIPLFLVDGVPVFNHQQIIDYDPLLVEDITIYTDRYAIGNVVYEGVVKFDTYKENLPSFDLDSKVSVFNFQGALIPACHTGVKKSAANDYPDYRQTIYWNPIVDLSPKSSYHLECVTPIYKGDFVIVVEGVTESGIPIFSKSYFQVR